jgi:hypothetical protein
MYSVFKKTGIVENDNPIQPTIKMRHSLENVSEAETKKVNPINNTINFTLDKTINVFRNDSSNKCIELDDLTLYIVQNTHDIFDLLNTYEYSINKNKYDIKDIFSFEDINDTITNVYNGNIMSSNKILPIHLNEENPCNR